MSEQNAEILPTRRVGLAFLPTASLRPNEWNPQVQDKATFDALCEEMRENGCIDALQVVPMTDGTYVIIGGEHRWEAAKAVGLEELPCVLLSEERWQDADLQKFVTVRLNAIKGKLDPAKFLALHEELADRYGREAMQRLMGFTDAKAFARVLGGVKKALRSSLPKEMRGAADKALNEAKTIDDLGVVLNTLFAQFGDTLDKSFMVFAWGSKNHLYISMNKKTKRAMDRVVEACRLTGQDINELLEPAIVEAGKRAVEMIEAGETSTEEASDAVLDGNAPTF